LRFLDLKFSIQNTSLPSPPITESERETYLENEDKTLRPDPRKNILYNRKKQTPRLWFVVKVVVVYITWSEDGEGMVGDREMK